jgi:hypothetical protein
MYQYNTKRDTLENATNIQQFKKEKEEREKLELEKTIKQMESVLEKRCTRATLDTTKNYIQVRTVDKKETRVYVGTFVRSYCMGSGDGMTVHIEFNDNGRITRVDEEMWGSLSGEELSYFIEKE